MTVVDSIPPTPPAAVVPVPPTVAGLALAGEMGELERRAKRRDRYALLLCGAAARRTVLRWRAEQKARDDKARMAVRASEGGNQR